jgi:hypothetical protein
MYLPFFTLESSKRKEIKQFKQMRRLNRTCHEPDVMLRQLLLNRVIEWRISVGNHDNGCE